MSLRQLGKTSLWVSKWCLGGNVFGWTANEADSFAVLDAYVAEGGNFIDTAEVYSRWVPGHQGGESEAVIGRWLASRGRPEGLVIATKVGAPMGDEPHQKGLGRRRITEAVEGSLRRLGVEMAIDAIVTRSANGRSFSSLRHRFGRTGGISRAGVCTRSRCGRRRARATSPRLTTRR